MPRASCPNEVALRYTIPAKPVGTNGSRLSLELLLCSEQAGFETASSPFAQGGWSARLAEVTRTFTTPFILVAGNGGPGHDQCSIP